MPLIGVGSGLLVLSSVYAGPGASLVPSGAAGLGLGAVLVGIAAGFVLRIASAFSDLVHRVGLLKAADHVLGLPLGIATGFLGAYMALAAVVSVDEALAPLHGKVSIDAAAVAAVRAVVASQPQFGVIAEPAVLDELAVTLAQRAIPREELAKYAQTLAFYEESVRPQLLASVLGPLFVRLGEPLPFVGRQLEYPAH